MLLSRTIQTNRLGNLDHSSKGLFLLLWTTPSDEDPTHLPGDEVQREGGGKWGATAGPPGLCFLHPRRLRPGNRLRRGGREGQGHNFHPNYGIGIEIYRQLPKEEAISQMNDNLACGKIAPGYIRVVPK